MKNFVIATVSAIALLSTAANAEEMKEGEKHQAHKHHAHKHHGHHMGHHHHGHALAVYVAYPPYNVAALGACQPEYYQGNPAYSYIWHEGYFWYPHAHAELLMGYMPHHMHGAYWYPSRLHPHMIYVEQKSMIPHELYPAPFYGEHMGGMHKHKAHHKGHMKHHAKEMHHKKEKSME